MSTLGIIGAGDLGKLISYHAISDNHFDNIVFFDDFIKKGTLIEGYKVIGETADIENEFKNGSFSFLMNAIGYKHINERKELFELFFNKGIPFAKIVHSSTYVDKSCKIGSGVFIHPGCTLDRNVTIGNNVLLNTSCTIAHDTIIESHCFLSPRVAIAGFSKIEQQCFLGINCTIIDNISICSQTQIGGGSVVTKSIYDSGLYVGVPAKKIKNVIL